VLSAAEVINLSHLQELEDLQPGAFSAATFHLSGNRIVAVYNPLNEPGRTNSDIAHELAHILLSHDVREVQQLAGHTFFTCDPEQEEEANWLAGCLLLPRPLLLRAARSGLDSAAIAVKYTVSEPMAAFRLRTTGVARQIEAARRHTARRP
jgi:Zn-dependent peptidase ImmA (M78 family)